MKSNRLPLVTDSYNFKGCSCKKITHTLLLRRAFQMKLIPIIHILTSPPTTDLLAEILKVPNIPFGYPLEHLSNCKNATKLKFNCLSESVFCCGFLVFKYISGARNTQQTSQNIIIHTKLLDLTILFSRRPTNQRYCTKKTLE